MQKIYNYLYTAKYVIEQNNQDELLKNKILDKRELKSIDYEILSKVFLEEKKGNKKLYKKIEDKKFNEKSKEFKEFVKIVRKRLREIYGVFFKDSLSEEQKENLLKKLGTENEDKTIKKILKSHLSTYERYSTLVDVYKQIFSTTGCPDKILDLGCGYTPFSYSYLGYEPEYVASDISKDNLNFIKKYFDFKKINGQIISADLTEKEDINKISEISKSCEVCFLFKLLDSLEAIKRGSSKELLDSLKCDFFVISFPKGTISGKKTITSKRKWFQKIMDNMTFLDEFEMGPETYYVLKH